MRADERSEQNSRLTRALAVATGDDREELVRQLTVLNIDIARSVARRFDRRGESLADLEQVACLSLFRAARKFDLTRGEHFLPYAVATIRGDLRHFFRDHVWMIRPSRPVQTRHNALRKSGSNETSDGVAIETCYRPLSLDMPIDANDELTLAAIVPDDTNALERAEVREYLRPYLSALTPRARTLLHLRYVEDRTQHEIGKMLGVSQVHVSRLLGQHLDELRVALGVPAQSA
ncbi:sigma-70 family RNA polymerase sigma factor [Nocardioides conyzicola]|uniref:RNA polymerase sigma factor SigF n=1 Tax=Nocardioides conyzicola TaxID=1651781 RepID=A0ABP8WN87_9ACTN